MGVAERESSFTPEMFPVAAQTINHFWEIFVFPKPLCFLVKSPDLQ